VNLRADDSTPLRHHRRRSVRVREDPEKASFLPLAA